MSNPRSADTVPVRATCLDTHTPEHAQQSVGRLSRLLSGDSDHALALVPPEGAAAQALHAHLALHPSAPAGTALVVGTSGSTGAPKLALLCADALRAACQASAQRLGGSGQWLLALPTHTIAGAMVLLRSALAGTVPVVVPAGPFTASAFVHATQQMNTQVNAGHTGGDHRFTALVPTQLHRLLQDQQASSALAQFDAVLLGGSAAEPALLERARALGIGIVTTYGMTETCGGCVYDGQPLPGVQVRIDQIAVGKTGAQPEAEPAHGRVHLCGPMLFSGYLGDPELTAQALHQGWLATNDLGSLEERGTLRIHGRLDDVVISGGVNVSLSAVERAAATLPELADVELAAVAVPDAQWGQQVVLAVVLPATQSPDTSPLPELERVRAHVAALLGPAAAPQQVVRIAAIPQLAPGKRDRLALQQLLAW